jgi:hypothetical protein
MKLRHPWMIRAVAWTAARIICLWLRTLRCQFGSLGPNVEPLRADLPGWFIYAFWHENLLLPAYLYGRPDIYVLVSQHADGQLIAEVCGHLGFRLIRGSTTRGGVEAVRRMLRCGRQAHLAITPDGPRGPRRRVQPGVVYVAAKTGLPIVAAGFGYERAWRMNSWDRFALPRPWCRAACVLAAPIAVPADAGREQLEHYRRQVEAALLAVTDLAEHWAQTGAWAGTETRKKSA